MSKLKILISHTSLYKFSGWGRIFPLAVGLVKNGQDVTILTTNPSFSILTRRLVVDGVKIIIFPEIIPSRVSRMGFGLLSLFLKLFHVLSNKYDVVHSDNGHRPLAGMPCRLSKRIHKSVYVAEWYDWYGKGGQYDTKKKLFKALLGWYELKYEIKDKKVADGVVVLSEVLRERAQSFKTNDKIVKIHGGADVSSLQFLLNNSKLKIKLDINPATLTLGYINSNSYILEEFFPLVEAIQNYQLGDKVKILLYGDSDSLQKQLSPEISKNILFMGWVDFATDYEKLQVVDIFFLFKQEILGNRAGWPNCIGDYLACGRPVLLNPVGEIVEFSKQYPFAFIETTKKPEDIYEKLLYIMNNRESIRQTGARIRELAEDKISWESKSIDLLNFYNYLIQQRS